MDVKMKEYPEILGFDSNNEVFPKMKEVRTQFLKLAILRPPDKSENDMKELLKVFKIIGRHIEQINQEDPDDREESNARKHFKDFNWKKLIKQSISISILTLHASAWIVLNTNYGNPIVNSGKSNGKKFTVQSFEGKNQPPGKVYVINDQRSTILIQAEKCNLQMNIAFLNEKLPKLFEVVLKVKPNSIDNKVTKQEIKTVKKETISSSLPKLNLRSSLLNKAQEEVREDKQH